MIIQSHASNEGMLGQRNTALWQALRTAAAAAATATAATPWQETCAAAAAACTQLQFAMMSQQQCMTWHEATFGVDFYLVRCPKQHLGWILPCMMP